LRAAGQLPTIWTRQLPSSHARCEEKKECPSRKVPATGLGGRPINPRT
jgi:hypothetical protein